MDSTDTLIEVAGATMLIGTVDRMINNRRDKKKKQKNLFDF